MMALLLEGRFLFVTSSALLTEFQRVIRSEKLRDVFDEPDELVELVRSVATVVEPAVEFHVLEDEPDNRVLEAAYEAGADFIVTGEKAMRELKEFKGIRIVSPADFVEIVRRPSGEAGARTRGPAG